MVKHREPLGVKELRVCFVQNENGGSIIVF
jgi:hypothetical protein